MMRLPWTMLLVGFLLPATLRAEPKLEQFFAQNCVKCHGPKKQEGKVRLDKPVAALFADAGRVDLEQQENSEMEVLQAYLPEALSESECTALVDDVISAMDATSMKEMGKVMAEIQTRAQRRSDMAALSALVKARLSG